MALGDSFTEGLNDPGVMGEFRGWADRLAEYIERAQPGLRYANLAVRGKLLGQIADEQVPVAVGMRPDLVSISAGGNDMLRPGADPDVIAARFYAAARELRGSGAEVLVFTGFDPALRSVNGRASARWRGKVATLNVHLRSIADRLDLRVVDLWSMPELCDDGAWDEDRLHMTPEGHRRLAVAIAEFLDVPTGEEWRGEWPERVVLPWREAKQADLHWARTYLLPWVQRRIKGRSSGDGRVAKRPELAPVLTDHDR
ncbi:SGNH/GDSL hydrolase family protein [Actinocorallia longicatena]|uniref:SGNH/GDSL hydrolase family protein n=1 Tax=Actinocorallia longicatena TaxID=111803 RepID=A0ABP6QNI9_9ACTN